MTESRETPVQKSPTQAPEVNYQHKWLVLLSTGSGILLTTLDTSIVNTGLPTLSRYFNADLASVQWVVLAYLLTVTTLMLSIGRLADMVGKKRIYNLGFIVFIIGSALCGFSSTLTMLIVSRVVQGIGAAMVMALGMAIVTEAFPANERGRALGINGSIVSVGIITGPSLGSLIIDQFSWHWVFFINLPVGIIGTLLVHRFVPHYEPKGRQIFDLKGSLLMFAGLLSLLLALTFGQHLGFTAPLILALFASFLVCLVLFIKVEQTTEQPLIDMNIFRSRLLTINLATGFLTFIAMGGTNILMPFYLQNVMMVSLRTMGVLMAVHPALMGITAPFSGRLSDKYGSRPIAVIGLAVLILGYGLVSTLRVDTPWWGYVWRMLPIGLGMGIFQSPNNSAVMGSAPRERLGVVSSMLSVTRTLGTTTGVATLGSIWASNVIRLEGSYVNTLAASPQSQLTALNTTYYVVIALLIVAFALALWSFSSERRSRAAAKNNLNS